MENAQNKITKIAFLGDSNIKRADTISAQIRSIECHCYPEARLCPFNNMFSKYQTPQEVIEVVILGIRINIQQPYESQLNTALRVCFRVPKVPNPHYTRLMLQYT